MRIRSAVAKATIVAAAFAFAVSALGEATPTTTTTTLRFRRAGEDAHRYANVAGPQGTWGAFTNCVSFPPNVNDFGVWEVGTFTSRDRTAELGTRDPLCLYAWCGGESAFRCGIDVTEPTLTVTLEPSGTIAGRVTAPDGTPVKGARAGVLLHGPRHVHPWVSQADESGAFTVRPPASCLSSPQAELFATADGWPDFRAPLPADATRTPVEIRFPAGRHVRARLAVAETPRRVAIAALPDVVPRWVDLPATGRLDTHVPSDTRKIVILDRDCAARTVDLPATGDDLDLGDAAGPSGRAVTGCFRGRDRRPIDGATVALFDGDGVCVAQSTTTRDGTFALAHVGAGEHVLKIRATHFGASAVDRLVAVEHVTPRDAPYDVALGPGVVFALVDAAGKPAPSALATVALYAPDAKDCEYHHFASPDRSRPTAELQLDPLKAGHWRADVRVAGRRPVQAQFDVCADGVARVVVKLAD